MIFYIAIAVTVILFVVHYLLAQSSIDGENFPCLFFEIIGASVCLVMVIILGVNRINEQGILANKQATYEALVYKAETETIRDEFGIVNKEYIDEIQEWNADLAWKKTMQNNKWVGIFYPHIYDELEYIDLDSIKMIE